MRSLTVPSVMSDLPSQNKNQIGSELDISRVTDIAVGENIKFIFVCFTNRCGSNYLCDLLASTGQFNRAQECLNADFVLDICRKKGIHTLRRYLADLALENVHDGIFVIKVAAEQLAMLAGCGFLDDVRYRSMFVWIQRADKLDQAISLSIAEQNRQWAWYLPTEVQDDSLVFSAARIAEHIFWITTQNLAFDHFFAINGIRPLPIYYESLLDHRDVIVRQIVHATGRSELPVNISLLEMKRQAREINLEWRDAFLQEQMDGTKFLKID